MKILLCECSNRGILDPELLDVARSLVQAGSEAVTVVNDLCGLAARRDPLLREICTSDDLVILGCHPRAMKWLFHAAGAEITAEATTYCDLRSGTKEELIKVLGREDPAGETPDSPPLPSRADESPAPQWPPWFPVIDYERCQNCRQCFEFCIFGAYELDDDDNVVVTNPRNCKDNCPACARICPTTAIIFPKFDEEPFNGTEIVDDSEAQKQAKLDRDKILGSDIYAALAARKKKKKNREVELLKAKSLRKRFMEQGD